MANPTYTLYKRANYGGKTRYFRAACHQKNHKIMQDVCFVDGQQVTVPSGRYYLRTEDGWLDAGTDALKAERMRSDMLSGNIPMSMIDPKAEPKQEPVAVPGKTPLKAARDKYFKNLENRGADPKTLKVYRAGVDPFVETCKKTYVEDVKHQDILDFMG